MTNYETEDQQLEAVKQWWRDNGKAVIVGAVLGFGAIIGGRMWFNYADNQRIAASAEYSQLQTDMNAEQQDAVVTRGEFIMKNFSSTPYAAMAAMMVAKVKVDAGELAAASSKLQWVIDHADQPDLLHAARLRLARVLAADGQAQQALTLLDNISMESYSAAYHEVRGDIYVLLNRPEEARTAYHSALDAMAGSDDSRLLQMKLDDLGA